MISYFMAWLGVTVVISAKRKHKPYTLIRECVDAVAVPVAE